MSKRYEFSIENKQHLLEKLEAAIRSLALQLPWFKDRGYVQLVADSFGVLIKLTIGGNSRHIFIAYEEMDDSVLMNYGYSERIKMQLEHLFKLIVNNNVYAEDDQVSYSFEL